MKPVFEVHPIQGKILKVLLFQPLARFSDLNPDKVSSDHLNFHLKALLKSELVEKSPAGKYNLTTKGKEFANRFDVEKIVLERQGKLTLTVVAVKKEKGKKYYLLQQRLKQPYFGYFGAISGKIRWGETVYAAAKRELFEETGLKALKMTIVGLTHKSDYTKGGDLLEDKFFFRIRVDKFSGSLKENVEGGKNFWATKLEVLKLKKLFPDMQKLLGTYDQDQFLFVEKSYVAQGY